MNLTMSDVSAVLHTPFRGRVNSICTVAREVGYRQNIVDAAIGVKTANPLVANGEVKNVSNDGVHYVSPRSQCITRCFSRSVDGRHSEAAQRTNFIVRLIQPLHKLSSHKY
jgi:hypothetical protein